MIFDKFAVLLNPHHLVVTKFFQRGRDVNNISFIAHLFNALIHVYTQLHLRVSKQ